MASLLPIIQDILPMILPGSVAVTKAADVLAPQPPPPPTTGPEGDDAPGVRVISRHAVVNKTDKMCASVLLIKPDSSSSIRHHGEQEAIIYVVSGKGALLSQPKGDKEDPERHGLAVGDFVFVPAWTEHRFVNDSGEEDFHLVVILSGGQPVEVNLTDWGGREIKAAPKGQRKQ